MSKLSLPRMQLIVVETPDAALKVIDSLLRNGCTQFSFLFHNGAHQIQYAPPPPPPIPSPPQFGSAA